MKSSAALAQCVVPQTIHPTVPRLRLVTASIEDDCVTALASSYQILKTVQVTVRGGTVILSGNLPTFYMKQMAQETVRKVSGVTKIENRTTVDAA